MLDTYLSLRGRTRTTRRAILSTYKMWLKILAGRTEEQATPQDALKFIAQLNARGLAQSSIRRHFYSLFSYYEFLFDTEVITKNPFRSVKGSIDLRSPAQVRPTASIDFADVKRLLNLPHKQIDKAMLAMLFGTGVRRSELIAMRVENIRRDDAGYYIILENTKNKTSRNQPIPEWAMRELKLWLAERPVKGVIFPISVETVYRRFRCYAHELGIKAAPHAARAAYATKLLASEKGDREVAAALGHKTVSMVSVYDKRRNLEKCGYDVRF